MNKIPQKIASLIAQVRTFSALGERYEIVAALHPLKNSNWLMKIKLLDSGEFMSYPYSEILCDPLVSKSKITRVSI